MGYQDQRRKWAAASRCGSNAETNILDAAALLAEEGFARCRTQASERGESAATDVGMGSTPSVRPCAT